MDRSGIPGHRETLAVVNATLPLLEGAPRPVRPPNALGRPGGLVYLPPSNYIVIVPDLHARVGFLRAVMAARMPWGGGTVEADLQSGGAVVVCVGDAFHAEGRARQRWQEAYREFVNGYDPSPAMDEEMSESLATLREVARLQQTFPTRFHFLKGNHENVANERGEGNFPFRKYAYEGEMVREWIIRKLGQEALSAIHQWEKALPLAAAGDRFLITHAEPARAFSQREIVDAYLEEDVIAGLTWTGNGDAEPGSVPATLEAMFPGRPESLLFGGHRPVTDRFALRQEGRYVQINTPDNWVVAAFANVDGFSPQKHIVDITSMTGSFHGAHS